MWLVLLTYFLWLVFGCDGKFSGQFSGKYVAHKFCCISKYQPIFMVKLQKKQLILYIFWILTSLAVQFLWNFCSKSGTLNFRLVSCHGQDALWWCPCYSLMTKWRSSANDWQTDGRTDLLYVLVSQNNIPRFIFSQQEIHVLYGSRVFTQNRLNWLWGRWKCETGFCETGISETWNIETGISENERTKLVRVRVLYCWVLYFLFGLYLRTYSAIKIVLLTYLHTHLYSILHDWRLIVFSKSVRCRSLQSRLFQSWELVPIIPVS